LGTAVFLSGLEDCGGGRGGLCLLPGGLHRGGLAHALVEATDDQAATDDQGATDEQ
jgi:hypothetical protein